MNGFERIRAVLNGDWPDKRPVMLHNFMMAARENGYSMKEFREDPQKAADSFIRAAEKYETDGILIDIDTATLAAAVGVEIDYPEDDPARIKNHKLKSPDGIEDLIPVDISENERVQIWLETCRIVKKYFGNEKFIRGNCDQAPFSLASMMRSPEAWMLDLISENENVFKLLNFCSDVCLQFIKLMTDTGVDMVSNGDSPAGPDMISPEMYGKYAAPYEKRIVEAAHSQGLPYALHICGNTNSILNDMVNTGTNAIELDFKTFFF